MTPVQREGILKQQLENWPAAVKAGKKGNPYATLCFHCYGRHSPPHDEICPHAPPKDHSHRATP